MIVKCKECGKEHYARPCHLKKGWGKYCSKACYGKAQGLPSRLIKYCLKKGQSASPATQFKKCQTAKEKNVNWKGGITTKNKLIRRSSEWRNWRKQVFERDNYTCQSCGINNNKLEPHHLFSFKDNPNYIFEVWNGQTLCRECHVHLHNELGWR